jgi:hypothetical protein
MSHGLRANAVFEQLFTWRSWQWYRICSLLYSASDPGCSQAGLAVVDEIYAIK